MGNKRWKKKYDAKQAKRKCFFKKKRSTDFRYNRPRYNSFAYKSISDDITKYNKIKAPENFSLVENVDEVLDFIEDVTSYYVARKPVFIDMDKVTELGSGAILLLLATMIQFKAKRIPFNGSKPDDVDLKTTLETSGFFRHLYANVKASNTYTVGSPLGTIYTHAQKIVDANTADKIIEMASQTVWGEKRRCPGVQRVLTELMHNTNNHAGKARGEKHWWISSNRDIRNKTVTISFMDFGRGIFDSLDNKTPDDLFYGWKESFARIFPMADSNEKVMKLILQGELHRTCTNQSFRGRGLPGIYEAFKKNKVGRLKIISNRVYADIENEEYRLMKNNLHGTFITCEINENIFNLQW